MMARAFERRGQEKIADKDAGASENRGEGRMEEQLSLDFLRVVENAAIAAARTMGFGDRHHADEMAVEAMRKTMDSVQIDGTIVIGEGERDEAPMLYIGEKVGLGTHAPKALFPQVDIAVDPLEGTNLCATGAVDLDAPVADNLKAIAKRLDRDVEDLVVIVLDRPRHEKLIEEIRAAGARIRLIGDGDLSAGISAAVIGTGVHAVMGTGGAPEGVLTAAALRCLNGQILARLVVAKPQDAERLAKMGVKDHKRIYDTEDLAPGKKMIFACCGVTDGNLLKGVRFFGEGVRTTSMILTLDDRQVRFIESVHLEKRPDVKVRFY